MTITAEQFENILIELEEAITDSLEKEILHKQEIKYWLQENLKLVKSLNASQVKFLIIYLIEQFSDLEKNSDNKLRKNIFFILTKKEKILTKNYIKQEDYILKKCVENILNISEFTNKEANKNISLLLMNIGNYDKNCEKEAIILVNNYIKLYYSTNSPLYICKKLFHDKIKEYNDSRETIDIFNYIIGDLFINPYNTKESLEQLIESRIKEFIKKSNLKYDYKIKNIYKIIISIINAITIFPNNIITTNDELLNNPELNNTIQILIDILYCLAQTIKINQLDMLALEFQCKEIRKTNFSSAFFIIPMEKFNNEFLSEKLGDFLKKNTETKPRKLILMS